MLTLHTGEKKIASAIRSISKRGVNLDRDIWVTAVSAVAHAQEHGDATLVLRLCLAMPMGSRVQTLIDWIMAHTAIGIDLKTGSVGIVKKSKAYPTRADWDMESLHELPWYDYKKSPAELAEFSLEDIEKFLKKTAEGGGPKSRREYAPEAQNCAEQLLKAFAAFKAALAAEEEAVQFAKAA